jgi:hypothetical protein
MDAATDAAVDARASDSSQPGDSGPIVDAALLADAGLDASVQPDAALPTSLSKQQFCDAQLSVAKAWLDKFSDLSCNCLSNDDIAGRDSFLAAALRYNDSAGVACLDLVDRVVGAGATYDGTKAAACASRYASQFKGPSQFMAPIASCPGGFDIGKLEGAVGHGRQGVAQFAECRATFVGTKASGAACTESLECAGGLRCRAAPGGGATTCQSARAKNESCTKNDECADGLLCSLNVPASGSNAAESACIAVNELKANLGNCNASSECLEGLICDPTTKKCGTAQADIICKL